MQFLIMHRTNPYWETGPAPTPELIERVGKMIGELVSAGKLLAGDGLRPSSTGVRVQLAGGRRTVQSGPFAETKDLIGGFVIMKVSSLEEAIEWTTRLAAALGDAELDIRPVTEAWDLGFGEKPPGLTTTRYMATYKRRGAGAGIAADARAGAGAGARAGAGAAAGAGAGAIGGAALSAELAAKLGEPLEAMERAGVLLSSVHLGPAATGACLVMSNGKPLVIDGPFAEAKELLGGFAIIQEESLAAAVGWAERYQTEVGAEQVEVREVLSVSR